MTKRIIAILTAVIILAVSVPAFAAYDYSSIDWSIVNRKNLTVCGSPWYGGTIESSSIASDAVSRVVTDGYTPYSVSISPETGTGFTAMVQYYITTPVDAASAIWGYYSGSLGLGSPLYDGIEVDLLQARVNYSGSYTDFTYTSVSNRGTGTLRQLTDYDSIFLASSIANIIVSFRNGVSCPGANCEGTFTSTSGDVYQTSIPSTPGPGYSGPGTILLQPGNLLILEKSGGFAGVEDITITAENLPRSPLVGPWTTRNTIKSFPSLPDPSSVFVLPYSEWTAIPGTTDWLGRSTSGSFVWRISQYTDDFAVYLNPIFGTDVAEGGLFGGNQADYNPLNKVLINDVSAYDRIMLVPVINRFGQSYIDYDSGSVIYDVSFNDDGTPEYSVDGESVDSGVANKPGGATSIDDPYIDTVGGILGILERGAEAIKSLTSGSQSFFSAIKDMFSWLPQEIQTVLGAALILVFAVGVIKILH